MSDVFCKQDLINKALKVLDSISKYAREVTDLHEILDCIKNYNYCNRLYAEQLNTRLRREYPEIELFQEAVSAILSKNNNSHSLNTNTNTNTDIIEPLKISLKYDYFGIIASVLLKEGLISTFNDFIEKIEEKQ